MYLEGKQNMLCEIKLFLSFYAKITEVEVEEKRKIVCKLSKKM
jgi:hypothetical protein